MNDLFFLLGIRFQKILFYFFLAVDMEGNETKVSAKDFLKMNMTKKVIKNIVLSTFDDSYKYCTYKVMLVIRGVF